MDDTRLEQKLDHIVEKIGNIDVTLTKQAEQIEYHIKRTDLLEKKLEPIEKHVIMSKGAFKLLTLLGGAIGLVAAIVEIVTFTRH